MTIPLIESDEKSGVKHMMRKAFSIIAVATVLVAAFSAPAVAYLEPGTGSIIVQSLIGIIAGVTFSVSL